MPTLHFQRGGHELFVHVLRSGRTLIGRSDRCDVALPSDAISRTHCTIDERPDGFWLVDRSRHGTPVDGETRPETLLRDGAVIQIGPWQALFREAAHQGLRAPTATLPMMNLAHEALVDARGDAFAATRAQLCLDEGPRAGQVLRLDRVRSSLGGGDSQVHLDDELPKAAAWVRVVRGRPMIEPGAAAAFLEGERVRQVTPVLPGEQLRLGDHVFRIEPITVEEQGKELHSFGEMVGRSPKMRRLFGVLHRMASHDAPVLLTGESGTGKELAAQGLHIAGPRADGPFVAINCAAVQENLFESELFGHVKGAFTGADRDADGAFQRADGGTLFLDEVGEMRLDLQAKLLRALESGEVRKVGGRKPTYPDVRVVAATNRHLPAMCREGTFREDLYYRLEVLTVSLPPLRERRDDIPDIARTLLARNHPGARLSEDAMAEIVRYDWPGNIRELRNVLTRAYVMAGSVIGRGDLSFNPWAFEDTAEHQPLPARDAAEAEERQVILQALRATGGNRTKAARHLGMPRSSLLYRLKRLKIVYP
jgi:transcriptional regulator with AAA-type ATPase domain